MRCRKVPETYSIGSVKSVVVCVVIVSLYNRLESQYQRNESKTGNLQVPTIYTNWGYPNRERPYRLYDEGH